VHQSFPSNYVGLGNLLGSSPEAVKSSPFRSPKDTLRSMERLALGPRGEGSVKVRQFTEFIVRFIQPKDYLGEILAVRNCLVQPSPVKSGALFHYINDPRHIELIKDPQRLVEEIDEHGITHADCDELAVMGATMCLQLGREVEFVALGYSGDELTHVGYRVKEPKSDKWIWCDPVAGPRERDAAQQAVETLFWSLD